MLAWFCPPKITHYSFVPFIAELGCECRPGYRQTSSIDGQFFPTCEKCPTEFPAASEDKQTCMVCSAVDSNIRFESEIEDCICNKDFYVIEDAATKTKSCSAQCGVDSWPGPLDQTVNACYRCPFEGQIYVFN